MDLVIDHVLQTLVVRWTNEYLRRQLPASETVVQHLHQPITGEILLTS